jgi:intraflagellar transport protein 140
MVCFEVQKEIRHVMLAGEFDIPSCDGISAHDQSIYTLEGERINVRSFLGIIKQTLTLTENEGHATHVDVFGKFLVVGTSNAYVKIWDLSKRDARLHVHPIHLRERIPDFQRIGEVKLNSTGAFLSVCNSTGPGQPISCDSFLYVLDLESSSNAATRYFNFNSGRNETDDHAVPPNSAQSTASASSLLLDTSRSSLTGGAAGNKDHLGGRILLKHDWDQSEPHFLVCQTKSMSTGTNELFVSMFFHEEYGLIVHDRLRSGSNHSKLVGIDVPFVYIFDENEKLDELSDSVRQVLLKDFEGLDASDKVTKDAVVKFCFYLSIGNMDEAFRAIKMIDNKKVWGNLARMCVKSRRLDVATICLGKMEHSCGARAMRRILAAKVSKDIQVAILAIYLNMHEEAEKVLLKSGQYELLNKFYQDSGKWQKALDIAEKYDRIHLRSTNYNYAKHLESKFDIAGAIAYYDKSGTSRFEVPRLLFEDWNALESYVNKSDDKSLKRWLAQYLESAGEMELALQYYELAEDYLSLVRVHCYCENLEKAAEIANSSGDKAACYHLARQYENMDNISNAIHFFSKASAYSNAIRICKEQGYADHIWNLALLASNNEKLDAAKYFERCEKPQYDKAVILYEKAGYFGKALDLAVRTNQHNALQHISKHLDGDTDPVLLGKAANFFLDNRQYDKAVDLFVSSKENQKALDLCLQYNITVTEDMAEKLTMDKSGNTNNELLNNMAEVCYRQGNYTLATKKWTQAGNRLQAMKALLKSGDTEKVIKFANISRERDIYILAANYLQTLDWRNDADIMRNIIAFYQKSKAFDLLGWFYQACADVEIDEYQNYEKALGALNECVKCLERSEEVPETKIASVMRQIDLVTRFVGYQRSYAATGAEAAIEGCRALLQEQDINASVRKGDIYGFLIEHYAKSQNFRAAQQMVEELRKGIPNVNLAYYISSEVLRDLEKATGIPLATAGVGGADDDEVGEEIVEEQD